MAFTKANLWPVNGADGNTFWYYKTADAPATVDTAGYFTNEAVGMLRVADLLFVVQVDDPAAPASVTDVSLHAVLSNDGATVDLSDDLLAATVADTD